MSKRWYIIHTYSGHEAKAMKALLERAKSAGMEEKFDEVLIPDSSRFWPADLYQPGRGQPSFDKQFVRDWLESTGWDKNSPPPALPDDVVSKTRAKYIEAYERLSGQKFAWA